MASNKSVPSASPAGVIDTKTDLLKDLADSAAGASAPVGEVLDNGTIRETNTVYEDRTLNPEVEKVVEYETHAVDLGNGTILTHIGNPKAE